MYRKDLLDEALLRPGRLEVQVEIGLPDRGGRQQILKIHTGGAPAAPPAASACMHAWIPKQELGLLHVDCRRKQLSRSAGAAGSCRSVGGGSKQLLPLFAGHMAQNSFLARDVDLAELAERTKNFRWAPRECLCSVL